MLKPCKLTFRNVAGPALFKPTFASGHLPLGQTFWSPTILYRQPYFAGFVGMENCIFSLCLDVRNFLKLLKKTCLHKGGFQDFFDIHFSLWTFGGSTVKFFSGSQRASHLCSPEKNFTVSPPNVRREKFMSKKSWKVAFLQARPFSRPKKSLHPSKVTRTDHFPPNDLQTLLA